MILAAGLGTRLLPYTRTTPKPLFPIAGKPLLDIVIRSLEKAGCEFAFHTYPGTSHWFFERDRTDVFNPEASQLAWERTIDFTNKALKLTMPRS